MTVPVNPNKKFYLLVCFNKWFFFIYKFYSDVHVKTRMKTKLRDTKIKD